MTAPPRRSPLQRGVGWAALAVLLAFDLVATGWFGFNERVVAMCRNVVLPGLGFVETSWWLTALFVVAAVVALVAWLRWGTDWIVGVVWVVAVVLAFAIVPTSHTHGPVAVAGGWLVERSSHEFAAVLVLMTVLSRARLVVTGLPGFRRLADRRRVETTDRVAALAAAAPLERCRAVAIGELGRHAGAVGLDPAVIAAALDAPDVHRRAARIGAVARWRFRGDPLRRDNAATRAALVAAGRATPVQLAALRTEVARSPYGVPASEPTWVRLLDGTLVALALDDTGDALAADRWRTVLADDLRLRHGRRHDAIHTPTSWRLGTALAWEHATATALAHWRGWIGDDDWAVLRQPSLGAAARGARRPEDARLVAAARIWAHLLGDAAAVGILERPSPTGDPIAAALDDLAATLVASPPARLGRDPSRE